MPRQKYSYNESRKGWTALVWDGTYTETGEKHRKRITSKKSSADLEKQINAFKRKVEENENQTFSAITVGEYALRWLEIEKSTKEINTRQMYENVIKVHLKPIEYLPLSQLTHSHVQQCINLQADKPKTCKNIKLTLSQIVKSAVRDKILPKSALEDILSDISLPKYQKPEKRPLNDVERQALERVKLDDRKYTFVMVLYYLGLRKGEALALRKEDFDFEKNEVRITNTLIFDHGKPKIKDYPKSDRGKRIVPIPPIAVDKIRPYIESCDGYLFHGQKNDLMTPTAYRRMWESIILQMNVALGYNPQAKKNKGEKPITDLTAHIFRHNYCTELCYQIPKISTQKIAKLMGDTEKVVFSVYRHILEERENIQEAFDGAFGSA